MIIPIDAETVCGKKINIYFCNIFQQIQNRMDFPQFEQEHLSKKFTANIILNAEILNVLNLKLGIRVG